MEKLTKLHKFMPVIIVVAIVIFGISAVDAKRDREHIKRLIEHLDEEVDEAKTGVERLLSRGQIAGSFADTGAKVKTDRTEYDFGKIDKKDGVVSAEFVIGNTGKGELEIGDITTSCSCASAKMDKEGIMPGESGILTVFFDPNFHEEPEGRFFRSVFVPTNDSENRELEFKIYVEIK